MTITLPDLFVNAAMFACGAMLVWNTLGLISVFGVEEWNW
jgi:hypothetical protein